MRAEMNFKEILDELARRFPSQIAISDLTTDKQQKITFSELVERVGELKEIISAQTRPDQGVALLLPTGLESACAFWASVCADRTYIPLFADMALERLQSILEDTSPGLILQSRDIGEALRPLLRDLGYEESGFLAARDVCYYRKSSGRSFGVAERPAAIVHTSGSTGIPKGIMHSKKSLQSAIAAFRDTFDVKPGDRVFTTIPHHFDVAIFDVFSLLMKGAEIIIPNSSLFESPRKLAEFLASENVACFHAVPTTSRLLLNYGKPERFEYSSLRHVITGGEILTPDIAQRIKSVFRNASLHNLYGPAEIICCTYFSIPDDFFSVPREAVPIGRVFGNNEFRLGPDGELFVTGEQLMIGYWNKPELTAERISFIDGKRWYATGDLVRVDENGLLVYRGRRDRMGKRRGIRIELDDIQNNLTKLPGVVEAAVVSKDDYFQGCRIIAHVCLAEGHEQDALTLKDLCSSVLPKDLVPDRFEIHKGLPRTSTGKIDYQTLARLN